MTTPETGMNDSASTLPSGDGADRLVFLVNDTLEGLTKHIHGRHSRSPAMKQTIRTQADTCRELIDQLEALNPSVGKEARQRLETLLNPPANQPRQNLFKL